MTYFSTRADISGWQYTRESSTWYQYNSNGATDIRSYYPGTGSYQVQVAKTSKDYSREITESIRHEVRSLQRSIVFFTEGVLAPEPVEVIFATDAACSSIVLVFYLERTLKA